MFIVLGIIYSLILFIAYFGNQNERELNKQKKDWERVMGRKYEY